MMQDIYGWAQHTASLGGPFRPRLWSAALVASPWTGLLPKRFLELLQGEEKSVETTHVQRIYTHQSPTYISMCVIYIYIIILSIESFPSNFPETRQGQDTAQVHQR